ncbi:MAG: retropepsin-like domain-containing protein [Deltaproteobacteria bacterium]|nr:retropepsin-like domain-containing protein [Deltaproteobacteria bacterium]
MGTIAFQRRDGLIFVPVDVWGHGVAAKTLHFVLDTGTSTSILNVIHAVGLGFRPDRATARSRIRSIIGQETGYVVRAPHVRSLDWVRDDFPLACHSFPAEDRLDGLLGADFFAGLRLVIDYGAATVELTESLA